METILRWHLALTMAFVLSFADYDIDASETVNCYDYLTQEDTWADEETEFWYVSVAPWVIENPTDMVLTTFGGCLRSLIGSIEASGKTGFVVLTNDGWIPSRSRTIDRQIASAMADVDIADAEYGFDMEEAAWLAGSSDYGRPD